MAGFDELRPSYEGSHFGASLVKGEISIWNAGSYEKIASVRPGFSGGSQRYIVDPVNRLVFSGTWEDGLTCFDYDSNRIVWHRPDLLNIQRVDLSSAFPGSLFLELEAEDFRASDPTAFSGLIELSVDSGQTKWISEDWSDCYVHPFGPIVLVADRGSRRIGILDEQKEIVGSSKMANFAILDVAFGSDRIAIAEGAKGMRILTFDGRTIAQYSPPGREANLIRIAFNEGQVYAVDNWDGAFITAIDPKTGARQHEYPVGPPYDFCFIDKGAKVIDSKGNVRRTTDGEVISTLPIS